MASHKKKWAKWLKVTGAALLLLAFGMQMEQNRMGSIANERNQAAQLSGRATTRALANENLYFTQKLATGLDDADKLHQAAIDYYEGRSSMMATSSADRQEVSRRLEELHYLSNHLAFLRLARGSALRREISNVDRW